MRDKSIECSVNIAVRNPGAGLGCLAREAVNNSSARYNRNENTASVKRII